mgnify:CR=1 FL=1
MTARRLTACLVATLAVVGLTACSKSKDREADSSTPGSGSTQALPPVIVATDGLEGTTVQVPLTNTTPVGAYRGAGRPDVAYAVERIVSQAAVELGMDGADLRRRLGSAT